MLDERAGEFVAALLDRVAEQATTVPPTLASIVTDWYDVASPLDPPPTEIQGGSKDVASFNWTRLVDLKARDQLRGVASRMFRRYATTTTAEQRDDADRACGPAAYREAVGRTGTFGEAVE